MVSNFLDLTVKITPDLLSFVNSQVDSLKSHAKNIGSAAPLVNSGQFMALFSELYLEVIRIKNDASHGPTRALDLLGKLDQNIETSLGNVTTEMEKKMLHKLFKKALDEVKNRKPNSYKSILLALIEYKHFL